jgi:uncharacterized membrane protein
MTAHDWSPPHPAWVYVALAVGAVAFLLLARRRAGTPTARSWLLLLLRAGVLALLAVILLNFIRVTETRLPPRAPEVVYLVDCSRSMALDRPASRLDQVKQAIARAASRPESGPQPRTSLYRFGDRLTAVPAATDLRPTDDATRLLEALERLPSHFTDGLPAGVVIFSDGRTTESAGFDELAAGYRRLGVPLHVFPVGDPVAGDVAVQDVIAPRDAPPGARLPVRVVVRSRGYAGRRAEVRVRSLSDPTRKPLATLPVTLTDGQQSCELLIDHDASSARLVAEVPPLDGEAILENNRVAFQIGQRKSKVRVIYMEGTLNNEYHWVRDALAEDSNIECLALEVNNQYAAQPILYRINDRNRGYPTSREELFGYDVVICSDINRTAFTQEQLDWTVELVHKRGGGFAMVGGNTSFGAGFWDKTAWDGLIPVDMGATANAPGRGTCWGVEFRVTVPKEAERHPIWRIVDDPVKNRQVLDRMPAFTGSNLIERLKPAATALGYSDRPLPSVGVMPVFACQPYGKGRTFAMSTDTTQDWGVYFERDWGEAGDNRYFRKFWRNVVVWLAENSAGAGRRLRVESDKVIYRAGEPIKVSARAYDDKLEEAHSYRLVLRLRPAGGPGAAPPAALQEVTLDRPGADGAYEGVLTAPPAQAVAPGGNPLAALQVGALDVLAYAQDRLVAQTTLDVQVLDDPAEFQDPQPDEARLAAIARASGGQVLRGADDLARLRGGYGSTPGEVVVRKAPAWDHAVLWLLLVGLLAADWVLRRSWGLA